MSSNGKGATVRFSGGKPIGVTRGTIDVEMAPVNSAAPIADEATRGSDSFDSQDDALLMGPSREGGNDDGALLRLHRGRHFLKWGCIILALVLAITAFILVVLYWSEGGMGVQEQGAVMKKGVNVFDEFKLAGHTALRKIRHFTPNVGPTGWDNIFGNQEDTYARVEAGTAIGFRLGDLIQPPIFGDSGLAMLIEPFGVHVASFLFPFFGIFVPSDERIKMDQGAYDPADSVALLSQLNVHQFRYTEEFLAMVNAARANGDSSMGGSADMTALLDSIVHGLYAQEVAAVMPSAVVQSPMYVNGTLIQDFNHVRYEAFIPDLIAAVQSLAQQLDAMSASSDGVGNGQPNPAQQETQCPFIMDRVTAFAVQPALSANLGDATGSFSKHFIAPSDGADIIWYNRVTSGETNVFCNEVQVFAAGFKSPRQSGFDIYDYSDPTTPVKIGEVLGPNNSTTASATSIIPVQTPFFNGMLMGVLYQRCHDQMPYPGIWLYDVTDPRAPVLLVSGVGDSSPYSNISPQCTAISVIHAQGAPFIYADGGRAFLMSTDQCDQQGLFTPIIDIWDITNPSVPNHIDEVNFNEQGMSAITTNPIFNDVARVATINGRKQIWGSPGLVDAWATVSVDVNHLPSPYFNITAQYQWPTFDWLNPTALQIQNSGCGDLSPDNKFVVARHVAVGFGIPAMVIQGSGVMAGQQLAYGAGSGLISSVAVKATLSFSGVPQICGPVVYIGDACTNTSVMPASTVLSSLTLAPGDKLIAVAIRGNCVFALKYTNVDLAGYPAMVIGDSHSSVITPGGGPDFVESPSIGSAQNNILPPMYSFFVSHRTFHALFNEQLNFNLTGVEPSIGQVGQRVCVNAALYTGVYGYWHMLNASTQVELAQFAPDEALRFSPSTDVANAGATSCPEFDTRNNRNLVAVGSGKTGVHILRYGGVVFNASLSNNDDYGLNEVAQTPRDDVDGFKGSYAIGTPHLVVSKKTGITYVATLETVGRKAHVFKVPQCVTEN